MSRPKLREAPLHITRIEGKAGNGWWVRLNRKTVTVSKFFSDSSYENDWQESRYAAVLYRNEELEKLGEAIPSD